MPNLLSLVLRNTESNKLHLIMTYYSIYRNKFEGNSK